MKLVLGLLMVIVLGTAFVVIFEGPLRGATSVAAVDTETVTTGAAETTGTVTLATRHFFSDETQLAVTCDTDASPGFTIDATRLIVNLTGLTVSTANICTTTFLTEDPDNEAVDLIQLLPFIAMMGIISAGLGGVAVGVSTGTGKGRLSGLMGGVNIGGFLILLVGVILVEVVVDFVGDVSTVYANQPEFVGVGAVSGLVTISYVIGIFSLGIGSLVGAGRGFLGK